MATQKPLIITATGQFQRLPSSDTLELSALGSGSPNSTTFLRGDGTWAIPPAEAESLALSSLTAATTTNTIASGDNAQVWKWALTSIAKSALTLTESAASINGGSSQVVLDVATLASSTATPLRISARGTEVFRVNANGNIGIKNTNPQSELAVTGTVTANAITTTATNTFTKPQKAGTLTLTHNTPWDGNDKQHLIVNVNGSSFTIANPSAHTSGVYYAVFIMYTTSHSIAFGSAFKGVTGIVPTATAGAYDHLVFRSDGTNLHLVGSAFNVGA